MQTLNHTPPVVTVLVDLHVPSFHYLRDHTSHKHLSRDTPVLNKSLEPINLTASNQGSKSTQEVSVPNDHVFIY